MVVLLPWWEQATWGPWWDFKQIGTHKTTQPQRTKFRGHKWVGAFLNGWNFVLDIPPGDRQCPQEDCSCVCHELSPGRDGERMESFPQSSSLTPPCTGDVGKFPPCNHCLGLAGALTELDVSTLEQPASAKLHTCARQRHCHGEHWTLLVWSTFPPQMETILDIYAFFLKHMCPSSWHCPPALWVPIIPRAGSCLRIHCREADHAVWWARRSGELQRHPVLPSCNSS